MRVKDKFENKSLLVSEKRIAKKLKDRFVRFLIEKAFEFALEYPGYTKKYYKHFSRCPYCFFWIVYGRDFTNSPEVCMALIRLKEKGLIECK